MTAKTRDRRRNADPEPHAGRKSPRTSDRSRSWAAVAWYEFVRYSVTCLLASRAGVRASGVRNVPRSGGALLVSNHLSYLDVFVLGLPLPRMLNYVARSTLFLPVLAPLIRSVGGFPIQREGMGASGLKETLRRLRDGGVVTLFPEGTRSRDGELGELKPGIAALVSRAQVPVVPAGIAGTFESWSRGQTFPSAYPIWIHYGKPILPEEVGGLSQEAVTALIRARLLESQSEARHQLVTLMADPPPTAETGVRDGRTAPGPLDASTQASAPGRKTAVGEKTQFD